MLERFEGDAGHRLLLQAFKDQMTVQGDEDLASMLADAAELTEIAPPKALIEQDADDNAIYFILAGRLSVVVNGREVAIREPGVHVGEMALIDPKARRSATVVPLEKTVVARVIESDFSRIAEQHASLWRRIAVELCDRLRSRNLLVQAPNPRPVLFIDSSRESLTIAQAIQLGLRHHDSVVRVWTDGAFGASRFPMEDLEREVNRSDFAVLLIGPDDKVTSREKDYEAPRDNVVFELGLFMGHLWRERTFIVEPRGVDLKIPSDLLGLNPIEYRPPSEPDELAPEIAPVCTALREIMDRLGPR